MQSSSVKVLRLSPAVLLCCVSLLGSTGVSAQEVSGVRMTDAITIAGRNLQLNGIGVRREKVFFKGYVIALYLEVPANDGGIVIQSDQIKRVVITMLRDVGRGMFAQAIESGIILNSGPKMPTLRARLDLLEEAVPDLKKGDVLDLTWISGTGTFVRGQGRTMTIPGKDFADALFAIWLGPKPVEAALKRALLAGYVASGV
jgi:hypothetical protein